jgi:hypothetical protein
MQKVFIERFSINRILPKLVEEEVALGAHSSIISLSPTLGEQFLWHHYQIRPIGISLDAQCRSCGVLKSFGVEYFGPPNVVRITCRNCKSKQNINADGMGLYQLPSNASNGSGWVCKLFWGMK